MIILGAGQRETSFQIHDEDPEEEVIPADVDLAKRISETLGRHYPGHPFMVNVDSRTGMAFIKHPMLSSKYGYRLKLARLYADPAMREVVKGGGELLERWNIARGDYRWDVIKQAQQAFA